MLRAILLVVSMLIVHAKTATGQQRIIRREPSTRVPSLLSPTDSSTLVAAAARVVLEARGAPPCVVSIDAALAGRVGAAFVRAGRAAAAALPIARDSVATMSLRLLGVRDGDTATVSLTLSGAAPPPSRAFWDNDNDYYFVRYDGGRGWQFVGRSGANASDYVAEEITTWRPKCLNRSKR